MPSKFSNDTRQDGPGGGLASTGIDATTGGSHKLLQDEDELRRIVDLIPQHIIVLNAEGKAIFANRQVLEYTGLSPDEVSAGQFRERVFHPEDIEQLREEQKKGLTGALPFQNEQRVLGRHGKYRWYLIRYNPLLDESGKAVRWYCTATDIEDLKQGQDYLQRVLDTTPALIHAARPDGHIDYFNQQWLDYLGVPLDEICGWKWTNSIHPEDLDDILQKWRAALASGEPFEAETRVRRADGEYRLCIHRKFPLRDKEGTILQWFGSSLDIEDRKRANDALRSAFEEIKKLKDQLHKENLALKEEIDKVSMFEDIVGSSEALRKVLRQVAKVAPSDSTVLILGETGTGKELVARAIHKRSGRAERAFIGVNCAAIPPSLIASELFGHEKGAFTGATQQRLGRFESASGGTIFLDEVGDLPPEIQIALLRVLQEREIERVGSNRAIPVDVRVLAATHRDLDTLVAEGRFREDLLYRLTVVPIRMPSLRERADDIPMLVDYFIGRFGKKAGKKFRTIDKRTAELFQAYQWPGNVRELQNVIERAVLLSEGDIFSVDETWLRRKTPQVPSPTSALNNALERQEKEMIEAALAECGGCVSGPNGAATKLGLPRPTLDARIKRLGINKYRFKVQQSN